MTPRRICLVTASLTDQGSANAILQMMANHWAGAGHQVSILTFDPPKDSYYEFDPSITYETLDLFYSSSSPIGAIKNFLARFRSIRKALKRSAPDLVVCMLDDPIIRVVLASRGLGIPVAGVVHTDPSSHRLPGIWNRLRKAAFPLADTIVVLTDRILSSLPPAVRRKATVIPNPMIPPPVSEQGIEVSRPLLLSVGMLIELKRHAMLLSAFAAVADRHPDWTVAIVGKGPLKDALLARASDLGIADRVLLPGHTDTVGDWYAQADLFVMPSLYEGFPLSLCEAMSMGVASIVTDYPAGPEAIVSQGVDGLIVPLHDETALAREMDRLMSDGDERQRLGKAATAVTDRFAPARVLGMWDALVERLAGDGQ